MTTAPQAPSFARVKHLEETRAEVARRRLAVLSGAADSSAEAWGPTSADPDDRTTSETGPASLPVQTKVLTNRHILVVGAVLVAAVVLTTWWLLSGTPERIEAAPKPAFVASASATAPKTAAIVVVDVVGKVKTPGIVELPPGSRVIDALKAAGGIKGKPDTTALNMARVLSDGEQILVGIEPVQGTVGSTSPGAATPGGNGAKVNLNVATIEQLDALPGVGPVTATAIISWRDEHGRFSRIEELMEVKGIGPATMADLKPLVMI